jgi:hypothetical protein
VNKIIFSLAVTLISTYLKAAQESSKKNTVEHIKEFIIKETVEINDTLLEVAEVRAAAASAKEHLETYSSSKKDGTKSSKKKFMIFASNPKFDFSKFIFSKKSIVILQNKPKIHVIGNTNLYFGVIEIESNNKVAGFFNYDQASNNFTPIQRLVMFEDAEGKKEYGIYEISIPEVDNKLSFWRTTIDENSQEIHGSWGYKESQQCWGYIGTGIIHHSDGREEVGIWNQEKKIPQFIGPGSVFFPNSKTTKTGTWVTTDKKSPLKMAEIL